MSGRRSKALRRLTDGLALPDTDYQILQHEAAGPGSNGKQLLLGNSKRAATQRAKAKLRDVPICLLVAAAKKAKSQ